MFQHDIVPELPITALHTFVNTISCFAFQNLDSCMILPPSQTLIIISVNDKIHCTIMCRRMKEAAMAHGVQFPCKPPGFFQLLVVPGVQFPCTPPGFLQFLVVPVVHQCVAFNLICIDVVFTVEEGKGGGSKVLNCRKQPSQHT